MKQRPSLQIESIDHTYKEFPEKALSNVIALNQRSAKSASTLRFETETRQRRRLEAALEKVAHLVVDDPIYVPVFQRLEAELKALDAVDDTVGRARHIAAQMAIA